MAKKTGQSESGDENNDGLDARVSALETGQQGLSDKIDLVLGKLSGSSDRTGGRGHEADPTGRSTADEIREQLEERDRRAAAAAREKNSDSRLAGLEETVGRLTEAKPTEPVRKLTKAMWGAP